jgi:hypothetical protein
MELLSISRRGASMMPPSSSRSSIRLLNLTWLWAAILVAGISKSASVATAPDGTTATARHQILIALEEFLVALGWLNLVRDPHPGDRVLDEVFSRFRVSHEIFTEPSQRKLRRDRTTVRLQT